MSKRKKDDLDTETSFTDMNIDGFSWYDPQKKKDRRENKSQVKLTGKEKRAMLKGAILAMLPLVGIVILVFGIVFLLAYIWVN